MAYSTLFSLLDSSHDLSGIYKLLFSYLQPLLKNNPGKGTKSLSSCLLLTNPYPFFPNTSPKPPKLTLSYASKLFYSYHLCLNCLDVECHSIEIQRLMLFYGTWGRYESEGAWVLGFIGNQNLNWRVVLELREPNHDYYKDTALLILEVIVTLVEHVANGRSKYYHRVLPMVNQIQPWLRVIGVDRYHKLYRMLLSLMSKCALFLDGEHANFDVSLTRKFFSENISQYKRSFLIERLNFLSEEISIMVFVQGIGYALKLWLNQDDSQSIKHTDMAYHNTLILLYHVGDMLSLKGKHGISLTNADIKIFYLQEGFCVGVFGHAMAISKA